MENEYSIEAFRGKLDALTESLVDPNGQISFEQIIQEAKNTTPIHEIESIRHRILRDTNNENRNTNTMARATADGPIFTETTPQSLQRYPRMADTTFSHRNPSSPPTGTRTSGSTNRIPPVSMRTTNHVTHHDSLFGSSSSPEPPTPVKTPLRTSQSNNNQYQHHSHHRDHLDRYTTTGGSHSNGTTTATPTISSDRRYVAHSSAAATGSANPERNTTLLSTSHDQHTTGSAATTSTPPRTSTFSRPFSEFPTQRHPPPARSTIDLHDDTPHHPQEHMRMQLNEMYHTLQQHEARIQELEHENDILLHRRPPRSTTIGRYGTGGVPSPPPPPARTRPRRDENDPPARTDRTASYVRSNHRNSNHHTAVNPPSSTASVSMTHHTNHHHSPGKQFVAEFLQIMDLPPDLHEPLSNIMDRQCFVSPSGRSSP